MRGRGAYNIKAAALYAGQIEATLETSMNRRKKLCWKCQKDKPTVGGHLVIKTGLHLFVCKECMEAKNAKA